MSDFSCNLDGYVSMVDEIIALALLAITVNASIIEAIVSGAPDLAESFKLMVKFLRSTGSWVGYLIGAIYFFGLDLGYADVMCDISGYGY